MHFFSSFTMTVYKMTKKCDIILLLSYNCEDKQNNNNVFVSLCLQESDCKVGSASSALSAQHIVFELDQRGGEHPQHCGLDCTFNFLHFFVKSWENKT